MRIFSHIIGVYNYIISTLKLYPTHSMSYHLMIGWGVRMLLIIIGDYYDSLSHIKYTDVDYRVFTDAAHHVWNGESPYDRHTYRYSPIIAWLMLPNVFLHQSFGKYLFCLTDILLAICIKSYIEQQLYKKRDAATVGKYCALFWLYNPFSVVISSRGNADSVSSLIIIFSIYFLQANRLPLKGNIQYFLSGIFLGLSIHLRLYPIVFCFPMYLSLGDYKIYRNTSLKDGLTHLIVPNRRQFILTVSTIASFLICTYGMYLMYGYKFLFETYIYHLFRKDTRHNFSLFFYHAYLRMGDTSFDVIMFTAKVFVLLILLFLSLAFGANPATLPFALFCQASVLVIFNSVITSQYYLWFLSLFPLIVKDVCVRGWECPVIVLLWILTQGIWLASAFHLEFLNKDMYLLIWISGVLLFISSLALLNHLICAYVPGHSFGIARRDVDIKEE